MYPVNRRERAGVRDNLSVTEREAAARRDGAQIRRQRAEQHSNESEHEHGDHSGHQSVTPFDHRGYVLQGGQETAVAQWPVIAAAQSGSGDPDDRPEHDEQVGTGGGNPGEGDEASGHGPYDMLGKPCVSRRGTLTRAPLARPSGLRQNPFDVAELAGPAGRAQEGRHLWRAAPSWVLKTAAEGGRV